MAKHSEKERITNYNKVGRMLINNVKHQDSDSTYGPQTNTPVISFYLSKFWRTELHDTCASGGSCTYPVELVEVMKIALALSIVKLKS
ncbi:hypothetical protein H5410_058001 [Solanum commersonii]|uniref:Uncharacterized protein n=1 Tax=Solanum commersonii TaxID=4109 RepID=A0A9J5WPG6_SOLCO|nr:hypothetical protein H5410_058001 [Solanum commersonii]